MERRAGERCMTVTLQRAAPSLSAFIALHEIKSTLLLEASSAGTEMHSSNLLRRFLTAPHGFLQLRVGNSRFKCFT